MITVLGSINADLVAYTERLPRPGETVAGFNFSTAPGGKGANQALAARKAGSAVRMVGAVGQDLFAKEALSLLSDAGTDLSGVLTVPGATGTALILVGNTGENMIAVVPGANGTMDEAAALTAVASMAAGDVLMLQLEIPSSSVEAALKAARTKGITSVLNTAPFTADGSRLASNADIIIANETEFALLAGDHASDAATRLSALRRLHSQRGQTYVVTLGEAGAIAIHNGVLLEVKSPRIKPIDTVGAGDAFCGHLAAGLDQGKDFATALSRAAIAGSLACLAAGAQPASPTAKSVEEFQQRTEVRE